MTLGGARAALLGSNLQQAVIEAHSDDNWCTSQSAIYSDARGSTGSRSMLTGSTSAVGQNLIGATYYCYETFLRFDTSVIPDSATVRSALLELSVDTDLSDTDFTLEARAHSFFVPADTSSWVAGADLGGKTLLASKSTAGLAAGQRFVLDSETAMAAAISKVGYTYMILCSSRHRAGTTPLGQEALQISSAGAAAALRPKLRVTWSD